MKKKSKADPLAKIHFETSQDDDLMKSLMESIPNCLDVKKDDQEELDSLMPLKKPKRAKPSDSSQSPDAELDLHGKTREEAIMMVQNFIMDSYQKKLRTLLIITGKGYRSKRGPVLKQAVQSWLKRNGTPYIDNFSPAPAKHGGSGAIWINLL